MSQLTIQNLFNIEVLEIDFHPGPTLVTGKNSSGKTSLAKILAALSLIHI